MATLTARSAYPGPLSGNAVAPYRTSAFPPAAGQGVFASPTESEFSETYDGAESIRCVKNTTDPGPIYTDDRPEIGMKSGLPIG